MNKTYQLTFHYLTGNQNSNNQDINRTKTLIQRKIFHNPLFLETKRIQKISIAIFLVITFLLKAEFMLLQGINLPLNMP